MAQPLDPNALEARLRQHVEALAQSPRTPGSRAHRQAAEYIRRQLLDAGFRVDEMRFQEPGVAGVNVLTEVISDPTALPLFIVGAHYDSVFGTPGADDNATGVAGLLELARYIQPLFDQAAPLRNRLQLAAYDLEESGFLGSHAHSRDLKRNHIPVCGMISLEMLGYTDQRPGSQRLPPHLAHLYPNVGNFIGVCGNQASHELLETVTAAMKGVSGLPVEYIVLPGNGEVLPESRLSDHSPFWDRGYSALMITDTAFFRSPHYHQPSDTAETIDYGFFAKVTAGVCEAVRRLLHGR